MSDGLLLFNIQWDKGDPYKMVNISTVKDATHQLKCSHCLGINRYEYNMKCLILKDMGDGRVKLLVFGDRYWRNTDHIKKIRYLPSFRVKPIKDGK